MGCIALGTAVVVATAGCGIALRSQRAPDRAWALLSDSVRSTGAVWSWHCAMTSACARPRLGQAREPRKIEAQPQDHTNPTTVII